MAALYPAYVRLAHSSNGVRRRRTQQGPLPKHGDMGHAVKTQRELAGMSQQALAVAVGVSVAQVSRWERDVLNPTAKHVRALVAVLGCGYSALLG